MHVPSPRSAAHIGTENFNKCKTYYCGKHQLGVGTSDAWPRRHCAARLSAPRAASEVSVGACGSHSQLLLHSVAFRHP